MSNNFFGNYKLAGGLIEKFPAGREIVLITSTHLDSFVVLTFANFRFSDTH